MRQVDLVEAAETLPELVSSLAAGEEVILTRDGAGVARLMPMPPRQRIKLGVAEGEFTIPDDFDAPLPADILALFEGR